MCKEKCIIFKTKAKNGLVLLKLMRFAAPALSAHQISMYLVNRQPATDFTYIYETLGIHLGLL